LRGKNGCQLPFSGSTEDAMSWEEILEFVVGEEKRLTDVLREADIAPLLTGAVRAGIARVEVVDEKEAILCAFDGRQPGPPDAPWDESRSLFLEGEPVGTVRFRRGAINAAGCGILADLVADAVNSMLAANLKRMLTTEMHTKVVNQSYGELLESNRQLEQSEQKYRQLAESLEIRVQERTEELKRAYAQMMQQEKMASVGQLAAGMAHEINNPLGFVLSNLNTLRKYLDRFVAMLAFCRERAGEPGDLAGAVEKKWRELKLDYLLDDAPDLIEQSLAGGERIRKIVSDLRGFSHIDDLGEGPVDLNEEINRSLSVLVHEMPQGAEIKRNFGRLPAIVGRGGPLCQVFLNIIRNACQARPVGLELEITTEAREDTVRLIFADNGPGIPEEVKSRIFEPFFTTRDVGEGMGMGLAVVHDLVTGFGGRVEVKDRPGGGAAFIIELPAGGNNHGQVR
jgi:two-component system NtrC family sensor kinase